MKMILNTLLGALAVNSLAERPSCFSEHLCDTEKTLLLYPTDGCDFEAKLFSSDRRELASPKETEIVLSRFFYKRGIPGAALSVRINGEEVYLPNYRVSSCGKLVYPIKCKQIFSKSVTISGGMQHLLYTESGSSRARIVEAPSEIDFSPELLRRLRVVDGLPDAVRSAAFRRAGREYRMASSDRFLTIDSLLPIVSIAHYLHETGEIQAVARGSCLNITLPDSDYGEAEICDAAIFTAP